MRLNQYSLKQKERSIEKSNNSLLISFVKGLKKQVPTIPDVTIFFLLPRNRKCNILGVHLNQSVPIIKIKDNSNTYIIQSKTDNLLV